MQVICEAFFSILFWIAAVAAVAFFVWFAFIAPGPMTTDGDSAVGILSPVAACLGMGWIVCSCTSNRGW